MASSTPSEAPAPLPEASPLKRRLRMVGIWVVSLGVLAFVFSRVSFSTVWASVAHAGVPGLVLGVVSLVCVFFADALACWVTFRATGDRLPLGGLLVARGTSYLGALLNYAVGQGAFIYFLTREGHMKPVRATAKVLLMAWSMLFVLLALASLGLVFVDDVPPAFRWVALLGWASTSAYLALVALKPAFLTRFGVVDALFQCGLRGHAVAAAVRVPHVLALVASNMAVFWAFSVDVPVMPALVGLPIVYVVAIVPISMQGLGTSHAAMVALFAHFATGAQPEREAVVLACGLVAFVQAISVQATIGMVCLALGRAPRAQAAANRSSANNGSSTSMR